MKKLSLLLISFLCAVNQAETDHVCNCQQAEVTCENLAETAKWRRKALFGMMHPEYMGNVLTEMETVKDSNSERAMLAAMAFFEFEDYRDAVEGKFNKYGSFFEEQPFAVFSDGKGDGFVLYSSGFGYRIGSQIKGGHITRIDTESMVVKNERTGEEETINFNELYLAGHLVDEKGIGMARIPPMSSDEVLKGWKK